MVHKTVLKLLKNNDGTAIKFTHSYFHVT